MSGRYIGKLLLTVGVLTWAILNLIPLKDQPFDAFLQAKASAHTSELSTLIDRADSQVAEGEAPSLFVALSTIAQEEKINFAKFFPNLDLADVKNLDKRNEILLRHLLATSHGKVKLGLDLKGGVAFTLKIDDDALTGKEDFLKKQQLSKAIDIMSKRVNALGVAEPIIRARGENSLEVQLPGISTQENPDVLANLQKPAKLTFHRVHRTLRPATTPSGQEPIGYTVMDMERVNPQTGQVTVDQLFIKRIPEMGGDSIQNAFASVNDYGGFEIVLEMTSEGARRFSDVTGAIETENNSQQYSSLPDRHPARFGKLAIVLDGQLYSAPIVQKRIPGGRANISGSFSQREALELANVLNNPLEFELKLEEMFEVGPSLADDARTASINAAILGAGLVVAFMVAYYLSAGIIAVVTVIMNLVIVLGVLASLQSTLTLPGVAALVLTIGMAVDANILIFERIREELRAGKPLKVALQTGYDKAFSTIVDANVTTLLTAAILIWLGTGPVKGFGVTLTIGICATMFCALVVSRVLMEIFIENDIIKNILHYRLFKPAKMDYLKYRRPAFLASWAIVIGGIFATVAHSDHIYGIDFIGGDEISMKFAAKPSIKEIYDLADSENLGEVVPVYQSLLGGNDEQEILKVQTEIGRGRELYSALASAFPEAQLDIIAESTIGASVSDSIKTNALLAIGVALLGILLYVAFRFEWGYGMGAVVSTIHDVLMTIGIFVILDGQFTAPMVAAILMIVGYSINDTIVVFDRIREELLLNPTMKLREIINLAINRTLSRTLLTSLTTFMAALSLYIFGASVIKDFALVFLIGILTGTFSSIFIAAPVFFWWHKGDRKNVEDKETGPSYSWQAGSKKGDAA